MPEHDVDKDARTEEPTPRRIEEARERGQVAKSQEFTGTVVLGSALAFMWFYLPYLYSAVGAEFAAMWAAAHAIPDIPQAALMLVRLGLRVLLAVAPMAAAVVLAGVGANVLQFGFVAAVDPVKPDFNRIHPARGLQRIFSTRTLVHLGITLFKMALTVVVMYVFFSLRWGRIASVAWVDVPTGTVALMREMFFLAAALIAVFLMLAVLDMLFQRYQYRVDLRMTREELKEELRRLEGDPTIRARRRAVMRRMLFARMIAQVPESDVVVTNPTEFAIALRYKAETDAAPLVLAKGRRHIAQKMREAAVDAGVPVVERPVLARGLYHAVEVGQEIPSAFYEAVAEILAFVYRLREQRTLAASSHPDLSPGLEAT